MIGKRRAIKSAMTERDQSKRETILRFIGHDMDPPLPRNEKIESIVSKVIEAMHYGDGDLEPLFLALDSIEEGGESREITNAAVKIAAKRLRATNPRYADVLAKHVAKMAV